MNKEELMAYAIKMYPLGTKFYPVRTDTLEPSDNEGYQVEKALCWSDDVICAGGNLYVKGIWAPVISHPEGYVLDEVVNQFPIY